jgi:hypothetical protein
MSTTLTAVIISGGTVLAAVVAGVAVYLGARSGIKAGLESGRVERMWENRVSLYEELATWVRKRREVNDDRVPACLRGETVQLESREEHQAHVVFPRAGQVEIWASPEVRKLHFDFTWWDDWVYLDILAIQDPKGEGRYIVASRDGLKRIYEDLFEAADKLIERIRDELSGHVK